MRLVVQRVSSANVQINTKETANIKSGILAFIAITNSDTKKEADYLVNKLINLRIFPDIHEKMNLSLKDINGDLLVISQFTLYANTNSGNRPSFTQSAKPDIALPLYTYFIEECKKQIKNVQTGEFGADMKVSLLNDGPVTIILDSK